MIPILMFMVNEDICKNVREYSSIFEVLSLVDNPKKHEFFVPYIDFPSENIFLQVFLWIPIKFHLFYNCSTPKC